MIYEPRNTRKRHGKKRFKVYSMPSVGLKKVLYGKVENAFSEPDSGKHPRGSWSCSRIALLKLRATTENTESTEKTIQIIPSLLWLSMRSILICSAEPVPNPSWKARRNATTSTGRANASVAHRRAHRQNPAPLPERKRRFRYHPKSVYRRRQSGCTETPPGNLPW